MIPGRLGKLLNGITEGVDAIGAVYDALPCKIRKKVFIANGGKSPTVTDKFLALAENWQSIDPAKAVYNFGVMQIEDQFWGRAGAAEEKARRARNSKGLDTNTKTSGIGGGSVGKGGSAPSFDKEPEC